MIAGRKERARGRRSLFSVGVGGGEDPIEENIDAETGADARASLY